MPGPAAAAENVAEAAESTEIAHEGLKRVGEVVCLRAAAASCQPCFTEAVVHRPLFGIAQHLVRARDLLEALFRVWRALVAGPGGAGERAFGRPS